jgi:hypothetical protein
MKNKWWLTCSTTQNMTSKLKKITIFSLILREVDDEKSRFQPAKIPKMTNSPGCWISSVWGYLWRTNDGSLPEPHKTWLRNIKISTFFLLPSGTSMLRKRDLTAKTKKMNNFFSTLEYKILRLFVKNKWWLTSRTTKIMTSIHKNFTLIPPILREIDAVKTRFQPAKTQKMAKSSGRWIQNFEVIY